MYAPVAQLDRVTDYESVGRGFESLPAYQKAQNRQILGFLIVSNSLFEFAASAEKKIKSFSTGACTSGKILLCLSV